MSRATFYPTAGGGCPRGAPPFRPEGYWATVKWASALVGAETRRALAAEAEIARSVPVLDDSVTESSANGVKSSGIWAFAKGLLPAWLVPGYEEPASAESVASAVRSVSEALGDHAADAVAHVTEGDRAGWDDKYTKREVDDKITRFAAHYLTDRVDGRFVPFATRARLADAEARHTAESPGFFYAGGGFAPTKNDYCVVLSDETFGGKTTRYSFVGEWGEGGRWQYQYTVNDTAFSEEQWAAINSTTSVDGDGNLCFAGIPIVDSSGGLIVLPDHTHEISDVNGLGGRLETISDDAQRAAGTADGALQAASLASQAADRALEGLLGKADAADVYDRAAVDAKVGALVGSFAPVGGVTPSVAGGVADLSGLFAGSNGALNGRLSYERNATAALKDRAFNALTFDGTEYNLSTALEAVTPTASGQPRDLLIVATATAATTISFTAGTIKGDKPTIDGAGTWLITLTEYAADTWYCRQIKMEDAA